MVSACSLPEVDLWIAHSIWTYPFWCTCLTKTLCSRKYLEDIEIVFKIRSQIYIIHKLIDWTHKHFFRQKHNHNSEPCPWWNQKPAQEVSTTDTDITLDQLEPNAIYRILVVARGPYGTSLPSSMLLINATAAGECSAFPQAQCWRYFDGSGPALFLVCAQNSCVSTEIRCDDSCSVCVCRGSLACGQAK